MLRILLVSSNEESLSDLASALEGFGDMDLVRAGSGEKALAMAGNDNIDLVVTDEELTDMTGLELAGRLLSVNPMINCASVSHLSPGKFHEAGEGLGLMAQLPPHPGREDAEKLLRGLRNLKGLMNGG